MCLHIFSPGKTIQLDYVAETVDIAMGGSTDIVDILLTNHTPTQQSIERIHFVYPHAIPSQQRRNRGARSMRDLTHTWTSENAIHNRFYQTKETKLEVKHHVGHEEVIVQMPDPNNILQTIPYRGEVKGKQQLTVFTLASTTPSVNDFQWKILSTLGWSVFTLIFTTPIQYHESRWLRLQGKNGIIHQNQMHPLEAFVKKWSGLLIHSFEIAGPLDVKYRITSALKAAKVVSDEVLAADSSYLAELNELQTALLTKGIDAPDTVTIVRDWRINIFWSYYRQIDEPSFWGDIKPAGGLSNPIRDREGNEEMCLQWKAGEMSITPQHHGGHFGARIKARNIPLFVAVLPWICFFMIFLLNGERVLQFLARLWLW